jgi:hypothetical protein
MMLLKSKTITNVNTDKPSKIRDLAILFDSTNTLAFGYWDNSE